MKLSKNTDAIAVKLMVGASILALAAGAATSVRAQSAGGAAADEQVEEIVVVGARKAEQSAIQRKKRAATNQDSIVADDVGNFPDKNVGEAVARIAGVALDVADDGQQGGFSIRGQSADLVRVEVDGMSMLATGSQDGRSVTGLGDMSSDLIKSVDVIKGQTADMTPGGVGGTVRIEQRGGLDFSKPMVKLNVQYQNSSLEKKWSPRINAFATRKFFDDRLGILVNFTYDDVRTVTDTARVSDKQAGYIPLGDHDNSASKSFTTPYDPIAAAVTNKAGCAALPAPVGTAADSRLNCYAQFEDFVPSLVRFSRGVREDKRYSAQFRADFRVNNNLTVFASYNPNINDQGFNNFNLSVASPTGTTNTAGVLATSMRNVTVNPNHYVTQFDLIRGNGSTTLNWTTQDRYIERHDQQHYLQGGADFAAGKWIAKARVQYGMAKSTREDEAFSFVASIPSATFKMVPENGLWTILTPNSVDLSNPASYYPVLGANGLSATSQLEYTPQADKSTELNYQIDVTREFDHFGPVKTFKFGIQRRDHDNTTWREGGFDLSPGVTLYRARSLDLVQFCLPSAAPASAPCKFGTADRPSTTIQDQRYRTYTLTQDQYQSLIKNSLRDIPGGQFFGGMPDRGTLLDSWAAYDFKKFFGELGQNADLNRHNIECLYRCVASDGKTYDRPSFSTNEKTTSAYAMVDFETRLAWMPVMGNFGVRYQQVDVTGQPSVVLNNLAINPAALAALNAGQVVDPNTVITATLVERRMTDIKRKSNDFLPSFNLALWPIEDQFVVRYSIAKQRARPKMGELTGTSSATCNKIDATTQAAIEKLIAQYPGQFNDPNSDEDDASLIRGDAVSNCTGRIGNPELKGYAATTQNLSAEWYPNADTQLSVGLFAIDVKSGYPDPVTIANYDLDGEKYAANTYVDGPSGLKQKGFEVAGRTAFTFLPWRLKYTGAGFNYAKNESNETNTQIDLFTGKALPPAKQSSFTYNLNLWYDDGRVNARIAYQRRDLYYDRTEVAGLNRIPAAGGGTTTSYYKVVSPIFKIGTKSLDARASYKLTKQIQLFAEGKNLLDDKMSRFAPDAFRSIGGGTPYVYDTTFSGRRYYVGLIATF
ncbi:TonB-dependent receptor [Caulobacter sp.]|uniref:TonB-dependent receptor n=1 Tax=Caulobacter sp. TaxID=78 RepID=UPI001AFE6B80|nr:TonB-dependent receptor [Caulobacter sp.]MBO9544586.1 TonB-dependent receptor [Caulobacter sp.]